MGTMEKNYIKLTEEFLLEVSRQQLINKSKNSDNYKDTSKGRNRWERRTHSHIATTVADYNKVDMNTFWKEDMLEFDVKVQGETNSYAVTILFENILREIAEQIKRNKNKLEFRCILQALIKIFNSENVYVSCTCPDFIYSGINHYSFNQNYNSKPIFGKAMEAPKIKNPNDTKGAGCKHINLVISNLDWMMKIASVINNYIYYCKDNMENNYAQYIFPKLYNMNYNKAIQLTLTDYGPEGELSPELKSDETIINLSNALGRRRTQFKKAPQPSVNPRFQKPKIESEPPEDNTNSLGLKFKKTNDEEEELETNIT